MIHGVLRRHAALTSVVMALACESEATSSSDAAYQVRDSAGVRIVDNVRPSLEGMWTVADPPLVRIGHQPGRPEYELYRVASTLRLSDGTLVIANAGTSELRWYSRAGAFLRAAGGPGDGPGEFRSLERVMPHGADSVAAFDVSSRRVSVYDADGSLVRTATQRAVETEMLSPVARFADGTSLWTSSGFTLAAEGPSRVERLSMSVYRLGSSLASAGDGAFLPWLETVIGPTGGLSPDGSTPIGRSPRTFGRSSWLAADAEGWVFGDNAAPELRVHAMSGLLTTIIRWPIAARLVTADDVQRDTDWDLARRSGQDPATRERVRRAREEHPPPPDTMPWFGCAFQGCVGKPLLLDAQRNVWVQAYRPRAEEVADRYDVFDSSGVWLGRVTMPLGLEVLWIGADEVVGRVRDELDIESVAVYRIERPQ
jgi:hypothetical protein